VYSYLEKENIWKENVDIQWKRDGIYSKIRTKWSCVAQGLEAYWRGQLEDKEKTLIIFQEKSGEMGLIKKESWCCKGWDSSKMSRKTGIFFTT